MSPNPAESEGPIKIGANALRSAPNLWLHDTGRDEWHVCYWDPRRRAVVVAEACNEHEAIKRRDAMIDIFRVKALIAALEAAGYRIVHPKNVTPDMAYAAFKSVEPVLAESTEPNEEDWIVALRAAIAAAPTYATPPAPQKE